MAENYDLIFGQSASSQYAWSDSDYQNGWQTVGSTPPTAEQFDALQRRSDTKAKDLNDRLEPLVEQNTANNRQPLTTYALKDIRYSPLLPVGWYLECSTTGTTSSGDITLPTPLVENATITDGTCVWKVRKISSADGMLIGVILPFAGNGAVPAGYLLCDGAAVSRTMYPDLFSVIGTTYGAGDGSTTFNVPDYNTAKRFVQGDTVAGTVKSAGLPNIIGTQSSSISDSIGGLPFRYVGEAASATGAFYADLNTGGTYSLNWHDITGVGNFAQSYKTYFCDNFDASRSNAIYGNSTTVQPNALTCRYIVKYK